MFTYFSQSCRRCVKVEVAVPNKPIVSVDVKQHFNISSFSRLSSSSVSVSVDKMHW